MASIPIKNLDEALAQLRQDPNHSVRARIDGLEVEIRAVPPQPESARRTAADVFRDIGPWAGEDGDELMARLEEARRLGGSGSVPKL